MDGTNNGNPVYVAAYPIAWRVEVVDEGKHRGFEYIRLVDVAQRIRVVPTDAYMAVFTGGPRSKLGICAPTTAQRFDIHGHRGTMTEWFLPLQVQLWDDGGFPNKIWNLIPVKD